MNTLSIARASRCSAFASRPLSTAGRRSDRRRCRRPGASNTAVSGITACELAEIRGCEAHLFVLDASFRELAAEAIRKHSRRELIRLAGALAEAIRFEDFTVWEKPGIRAQLLDTATSRLAMGFVTEHDDALHGLNAVSPAFTCALPFAEHVCDTILSNKCVAYTPSPTVR